MKSESHSNPRDYIGRLAEAGRYLFLSHDVSEAVGISKAAARQALRRLERKGEIATPARGVYVIVPPEYRALGCLPPDQFVSAMMERSRTPYYAGLLSAAQYHGAAHHRPQEFQVMLGKPRRPISCGRVRITFHVRRDLAAVPLQHIPTPRGTVAISTPEATAFDLIGYEAQIGGLDAVATILLDLAEKLDPENLAMLAPTVPLPWSQRLGYLLEHIDEEQRAKPLKDYVRAHARDFTTLQPSLHRVSSPRNQDWKLILNVTVEAET